MPNGRKTCSWIGHSKVRSAAAAEVYEEYFVPALFREPAQQIVQAADIRRGQSVLDVACGTGVLAREAAPVTGNPCNVTGLDRNDGMLAVAERLAPDINWQRGVAEMLPFADRSFDRVFSQFGLMFFDDRGAALREMRRVMKSSGRMQVAVWHSLDRTPGYAAMVNDCTSCVGRWRLMHCVYRSCWVTLIRCGKPCQSWPLSAQLRMINVTARFSSLEAWVRTDVRGWTLADMIDDDRYHVSRRGRKELVAFERSDGRWRSARLRFS